MEKKNIEQVEKLVKKYLRLIKTGKQNDARLVVRLLEAYTYEVVR